jgi:hypothetical protein
MTHTKSFTIIHFFAISILVAVISSCKSDTTLACDMVGRVVNEADIHIVSSKRNVKIFRVSNKAHSKLISQNWLGEEKSELLNPHGMTWIYPVYVGRSPTATWMVIVGITEENGATLVLSDI